MIIISFCKTILQFLSCFLQSSDVCRVNCKEYGCLHAYLLEEDGKFEIEFGMEFELNLEGLWSIFK